MCGSPKLRQVIMVTVGDALGAALGDTLPGDAHAPAREALQVWAAQWAAAMADGGAYASAKTLLLADAGRRATGVLAALTRLPCPTSSSSCTSSAYNFSIIYWRYHSQRRFRAQLMDAGTLLRGGEYVNKSYTEVLDL